MPVKLKSPIVFFFLLLVACNAGKNIVPVTVLTISDTTAQEGKKIILASDCITCHKIGDDKLIGPSFIDVSNKYATTQRNIDFLSDKIISGGSGNWGKIPMTPHRNLTNGNAALAVKYILSLKK